MSKRVAPSVLVADNNEFYRQVLGDFYRERQFDVRVARDGVEAVELIEQARPDLLVLDLIMPRIDGAQLCAWVKDQEQLKSIPVIILSGILSDEIEDVEAIRADAYIAKMPLDQIGEPLERVSRDLLRGERPESPLLHGFEKMYRREVVLELLQERRTRRDILDSLSEGIVELSRERRILRANRAFEAIVKCAGSDLLYRRVEEIFPEGGEDLLELFDAVGRGAAVATAAFRDGDRSLQAKLHRFEPDGDAGGHPVARVVMVTAKINEKVRLQTMVQSAGYAMMLEDISERVRSDREREQLRARLAQTEKMSAIGVFVSGAAHELNNPLTSVLGFAQLLADRHAEPDLRRDLERIASGARRCKNIVENLMAFAATLRPERVRVSMNELVLEAIAGHKDRLREINAELSLDLAPDLPDASADAGQLIQAFNLILDNAFKALAETSSRRLLNVTTSLEGDHARAEFADSGPGVKEEHMSRVFEPFFTTRPVGAGAGLGLSVAYGLVAAHDGRIGVRNRPGGGAVFTVEVPAGVVPDLAEAGDAPAAGPSRPTILIVDDESVIVDLLREVFEGMAARIDTAANGLAGLEKIRSNDYDLILLDLRMPDLSGQQIYEELARRLPKVLDRLIFMTGDTLTADVQRFIEQVGNPCLAKPFSVKNVIESARKVLAAGASG